MSSSSVECLQHRLREDLCSVPFTGTSIIPCEINTYVTISSAKRNILNNQNLAFYFKFSSNIMEKIALQYFFRSTGSIESYCALLILPETTYK